MKRFKKFTLIFLSILLTFVSLESSVFAENSQDELNKVKNDIQTYYDMSKHIESRGNAKSFNLMNSKIETSYNKYKQKESNNELNLDDLNDTKDEIKFYILSYLFHRVQAMRGGTTEDTNNDEDKNLFKLVDNFKKSNKSYKDTEEIFNTIQYLINEQAKIARENFEDLRLTADELNNKSKEFYDKTNYLVKKIQEANSIEKKITPVKYNELQKNKTYLCDISMYKDEEVNLSMADSAVSKIAKLSVKDDGKTYIQIEMNPISISFGPIWFSGYLLDLRHTNDYGENVDFDNGGYYSYTKANIINYFNFKDDYITKYNCKGYPRVLEFPFESLNMDDYWKDVNPSLANTKFKDVKTCQVEVFIPVMEDLDTDLTTDEQKLEDFNKDSRVGKGAQYTMPTIFLNSIEEYQEGNREKIKEIVNKANKKIEGKNSKAALDLKKVIKEIDENIDRVIFTKDDETKYENKLNEALKVFDSSESNELEDIEVPVSLLKAKANGKYSMGNLALVQKAKISKENGKTFMTIKFKALRKRINGFDLIGHLEKLWIYEKNDFNSNAKEVTDVTKVNEVGLDGTTKEYPSLLKFEINPELASKDGEIYVKVFVDAMESISEGMGTQNAKILVKGSQAKAWTDWPKEDPIVDNKGEGNQSGSEEKPSTNINELRGILKDSIDNANALIATNGADRFLSNAMANANSVLLNDKATSTDIRLALSALNNAIARNNPNSSGNSNNSWNKNNNSSWGNNNQGWGNNNSSWGNYGNNNQGWNNNSSWGVYNNNQNNNKNNGPVTIQYEVPVEVIHAHENRYSMANGAINHTARVEERNGQFRYSVQFGPMQREFAGKTFTGNLYNLFIYDGSKYQAEQSSGNVWSWVMNGKYDKVKIAVWVDAMDEIAGKGQGGGEQDAILSFNWNNAREVGRVGGNNNNQNQQNQQNQNQQKQAPQVVQNNSASNNFTDTSGHWAKTAIDYVVSKGYFAGLSNTEFGPNKSITRGQFVSVLGRMLKVNVNDYKDQNFKDVKSGMYYSPYITWANKVGIVSGVGQGNFAPDKELTREEMAVMMTKFLKVSGKNLNAKGNTNSFKDEEKIQSWAKDSVKEMERLGIVSGMGDGSFAPKSQFTRAQVAQVLYNIDHN